MRNLMIFLAVPCLAAIPAQAQDRVAGAAILSGAYVEAEATLRKELRIYPDRPELLLNLAAVYAKTGRDAEARALYQRVLAQDEVLMDLPAERTAGSHVVARTGLDRLAVVQVTAR